MLPLGRMHPIASVGCEGLGFLLKTAAALNATIISVHAPVDFVKSTRLPSLNLDRRRKSAGRPYRAGHHRIESVAVVSPFTPTVQVGTSSTKPVDVETQVREGTRR